MNKIILADGTVVIPTSFHGYTFSDGTTFAPSEEQVTEIKSDFGKGKLDVDRSFAPAPANCPFPATQSSQALSAAGQDLLDAVVADNPGAIILVGFMVISALKEQGIRDKYPSVLAFNATPETSRSCPQDKIIDLANWAW